MRRVDESLEARVFNSGGDLVEGVAAVRVEHRDIDTLDEQKLPDMPLKNRWRVRRALDAAILGTVRRQANSIPRPGRASRAPGFV
jgi:hypothetical protein